MRPVALTRFTATVALFVVACGTNNKYECIERTKKDVPNFQAAGTHIEVDYVLLHDGDKIYAACDVVNIGNLDPDARCGFRPLRTYECTVQPASIEKAKFPLSDLKCKDGDGHNVYLDVSKKDSATFIVSDWAAIATAVATFLLAIVAALQDKIRAWIMRPDLQMSVRVAPPECHKTSAHFKTATGLQDVAACYYFHVTVENIGQTEAREVEVFAASLTRRVDGQFEKVDRFTPMNLLWAHFRQPFLAVLSPKMPKMCDLAHIYHPNFSNTFGHTLPNVTGVVMAFDLQVEPNTKGHLVGPGVYRLKLVLGAANAKPKEYELEISFHGQWHDDETGMLTFGFGMKIL